MDDDDGIQEGPLSHVEEKMENLLVQYGYPGLRLVSALLVVIFFSRVSS